MMSIGIKLLKSSSLAIGCNIEDVVSMSSRNMGVSQRIFTKRIQDMFLTNVCECMRNMAT